MKKIIMNTLLLFLCVTITSIFGSLPVIANIGISSVDALNSSIGILFDIKLGTVAIMVNCLLILFQWMILKKQFKPIQLLQLAVAFIQGSILNLMIYEILPLFTFESYGIKVLLVIIGNMVGGIAIGLLSSLNFINFPLESTCMAISKRLGWDFGKTRLFFDILYISISITISIFLSVSIFVREGSIISSLVFAPVMGVAYKYFRDRRWVQGLRTDWGSLPRSDSNAPENLVS